MRLFGIIAGIMISIMGGYAFFLEMDIFVRLGWLLGIIIMVNGAVLLVPMIQEKIQAKKKAEEKVPEPPVRRRKKKKKPEEPKKKDNTNTILGSISMIIGLMIFISGIAKNLTDMILVYLVGSCVMFYGVLPLSAMMKAQKAAEEEQEKTGKKKKKNNTEEQKEGRKTKIVCGVISIIVGGVAVCHTFMESVAIDKLVAYNLVMQGVNCVVIAMDTYKRKVK